MAAPAVLAALLTAYELSTRSLWLDEGATVAIASQHGHALWRGIGHDGGNMLAYYLLLHVVITAFGDAAAVIRLPSVLADAATAAIVAGLGLRLTGGDRRVAASAGTLTAVSLPLVVWGQDARGYALMVTFTAGSFLALAAVLSAPPPAALGPLVAFGGCLLAALYIGFDAVAVVPAQLVILLTRRRHARPLLLALGAVALLCVPLLVLAAGRGAGQLFWVPGPTPSVLGQTLAVLTSAGLPPNFHVTALTVAVAVVTVLAAAAALRVATRSRPLPWQLWLPISWLLVPLVLAVVASLAGVPVELQRLAILLIPALSLILARSGLPPAAAWGGLILLLALRLAVLAPTYGISPENWKAATRYVVATGAGDRSRSSATACVAFYPEDGRMPFDYYLPASVRAGAALTPVLPSAPWSSVRPYVERYVVPSASRLAAIVAGCPALWLVASHEGQRVGPSESRKNYAGYRSLLATLGHLYEHRLARRFSYAAEIHVDLFTRL